MTNTNDIPTQNTCILNAMQCIAEWRHMEQESVENGPTGVLTITPPVLTEALVWATLAQALDQ